MKCEQHSNILFLTKFSFSLNTTNAKKVILNFWSLCCERLTGITRSFKKLAQLLIKWNNKELAKLKEPCPRGNKENTPYRPEVERFFFPTFQISTAFSYFNYLRKSNKTGVKNKRETVCFESRLSVRPQNRAFDFQGVRLVNNI